MNILRPVTEGSWLVKTNQMSCPSSCRLRLLLRYIRAELGEEVLYNNSFKHLLDNGHLPAALIEPQKESVLVVVRPERGVGLCDGVYDGLTLDRVMDDVVDYELCGRLSGWLFESEGIACVWGLRLSRLRCAVLGT